MLWEGLARALGAFYMVGGAVALVAFARSQPYDRLTAAIGGGWHRRHGIRAALLGGGALLTTAAGAMLAALDRTAPALMIANAIVQGAWLVYARAAFPPEDADDALGRRRVTNAFAGWLVATAVVGALVAVGAVTLVANPLLEATVGAAAAIAVAVFGRGVVAGGGAAGGFGDAPDEVADDALPAIDPSRPRRLMIAPNLYTPPLRDTDTDETFFPEALDLAADLLVRIDDLETDVRDALRPSREDPEVFVLTPTERTAFEARIAELVEALRPHALDGDVTWWLPPVEG